MGHSKTLKHNLEKYNKKMQNGPTMSCSYRALPLVYKTNKTSLFKNLSTIRE